MAQRASIINGQNLVKDTDFTTLLNVLASSTAVGFLDNGLAVTTGSVGTGKCLIRCTRTSTTPNENIFVLFDNTTAVSIDTTGTKKVYIEIEQANINNPLLNTDVSGVGIGTIKTGASYPASNYFPLASITGGVITDARPKSKLGTFIIDGLLRESLGANLASAGTVDLSTATGNTVTITGTTTITSFGANAEAGIRYTLIFSGALTLTHNATSLILPGNSNITTSTGDVADFVSLGGGNWKCIGYEKQSGTSIVSGFDINSLTEDTAPDINSDFLVEYDASAGNNKKVKLASVKATEAEVIAKTIDSDFITPLGLSKLGRKGQYTYTNSFTSLPSSLAIPHGLGYAPKVVKLRTYTSKLFMLQSEGTYHNGVYNCIYSLFTSANPPNWNGMTNSTSLLMYMDYQNSGTADDVSISMSIASIDSTNINLAISKTLGGAAAGAIYIIVDFEL